MTTSLGNLTSFLPDLALLAGALLALGVDLFGHAPRPWARPVAVASLVVAMALLLLQPCSGLSDPFPGFLCADPLAMLAKLMLLTLALLALGIGWEAAPGLGLDHPEYYSLVLIATFGMMSLAGSTHLVSAFISLEVFSLAMYVLAGFNRRAPGNREAALKYFLTGAFAAAFFLFGAALLFLSAGSASFAALAQAWHGSAGLALPLTFLGGLALVSLAFCFKIGLVPFHAWVPDTYQGAPTPVSAFLSAGAKVAGLVLLLRLITPLLPMPGAEAASLAPAWQPMALALALMAAASMTFANLAALRQTDLKRLLAYSSIAHSGYAMLGLVAGTAQGASGMLIYVLVYGLMNFAAFGLVLAVERGLGGRPASFDDLNGLGFKAPLFGLLFAVAAFSLAGLPPTAGFTAKFSLLKALLESGHLPLVLVAVANSLVGAAYYLRLLVHLYMKPSPAGGPALQFGGLPAFVVVIAALSLILGGLFPQALTDLTTLAGGFLFR
jgi:NADH-quinone oxidoreductase subunit N